MSMPRRPLDFLACKQLAVTIFIKELTGVVDKRWYCLESLSRFRISFMACRTWSFVPSRRTTRSLTPGS